MMLFMKNRTKTHTIRNARFARRKGLVDLISFLLHCIPFLTEALPVERPVYSNHYFEITLETKSQSPVKVKNDLESNPSVSIGNGIESGSGNQSGDGVGSGNGNESESGAGSGSGLSSGEGSGNVMKAKVALGAEAV